MSRTIPQALLSVGVLLLSASALAGIGTSVERCDRDAARKLEALARDALEAEAGATARRLLERALELYPENYRVRKALGFVKRRGEWTRAPEEKTRVRMLADADPAAAARFVVEGREIEAARARSIARAAERLRMSPEVKAVLLGLLDRVPREEAVHRALDHEEIDGRFVRPELVPLARRRTDVEARWAALRDAAGEPVEDGGTIRVPGIEPEIPLVLAGGREVASSFARKPTELIARDMIPVHRLLRALFPEGPLYDPTRVVVLDEMGYRAFLARETPDPERLRARLARSDYHGDDRLTLRVRTAVNARDVYAHVIGYFSLQFLAAPPNPTRGPDEIDIEAYAWLKEGVAYFLSLELFDTAETWFSSGLESTGKIRHVVPPPEVRNRSNSREWVHAHLLDGAAYPLPEVLGKSLNTLDLLASLEAYSFLRFLALFDPEGLGRLPAALRKQAEGSMPERAERALAEAFGRGTADLERLWRAYVLEVE